MDTACVHSEREHADDENDRAQNLHALVPHPGASVRIVLTFDHGPRKPSAKTGIVESQENRRV